MNQITSAFPDVLLIPEWRSTQYYTFSAGYMESPGGLGSNTTGYYAFPSVQWTYPKAAGAINKIPGNPSPALSSGVVAAHQAGQHPVRHRCLITAGKMTRW